MSSPVLATTSFDGTPQGDAGLLGLPTTAVLFGGERLNNESRSGGRFTLGTWLDPWRRNGLDLTYLALRNETSSFTGISDTFSILGRPFFNTLFDEEDARLITFPDFVDGAMIVDVTTEFQSAEALLRRVAVCSRFCHVDYYLGYRYAELDDSLRISHQLLVGKTSVLVLRSKARDAQRFTGGFFDRR